MKQWFGQLTPQERRLLVGAGLVVFIVLNFWFVRPHFGDLGRGIARMNKAESTLQMFRAEIAKKRIYQTKIESLRGGGGDVPPEDQAIDFDRTYRNKAIENGVTITGNSKPVTRTNEFFLEQEIGLTIQAGEKQLVDFLYSLGESSVRVRGMSLRPDPTHQQLNVSVTLVASYQKKATARTAAAATTATAPPVVSPKPATPIAPAAPVTRPLPPGLGSRLATTNKPAPLTVKRP